MNIVDHAFRKVLKIKIRSFCQFSAAPNLRNPLQKSDKEKVNLLISTVERLRK